MFSDPNEYDPLDELMYLEQPEKCLPTKAFHFTNHLGICVYCDLQLNGKRESKTAPTMASRISELLESTPDHDVRDSIAGMFRNVRTVTGPLTQTAKDRDERTIF